MSRTIKAIIRHMVPLSARSGSTSSSVQTITAAPMRRKFERKLRVVFAPPPLRAAITSNLL